jgi:hydrogenase expression/formation protein HypE
MSGKTDIGNWVCPLPLRGYPTVVMGHGSGGKMMLDLIEHLFVPLFSNAILDEGGDSALLDLHANGSGDLRLAFTTDSFVVNPLVFPGGDIGELAVYGTVNDLAMSGAEPLHLSAGFIIEEGLPMETLAHIAASLAAACRVAGVKLVAGDTKVVNKGHGDGLYINTTGVGVVPHGVDIAPDRAAPGDAVILSGTVGDHGMAIMSVREGLEFETQIESDSAPLNHLVAAMLDSGGAIHCLRDATRGGLAAALNELARSSQVGIEIDEQQVPVRHEVHSACEMLGLDPLHVANEGKLVAIIPAKDTHQILSAMQAHPLGVHAVVLGSVVGVHPGMVLARTAIGGTRIIDLPAGELLPRIC